MKKIEILITNTDTGEILYKRSYSCDRVVFSRIKQVFDSFERGIYSGQNLSFTSTIVETSFLEPFDLTLF